MDDESIHIGEIAHVISAGDDGPRADNSLSPEERGRYDNLILLCPTCHTKIDKAESKYPKEMLIEWKTHHKQIIANAFGARRYDTREEVRKVLESLFGENRFIFNEYGPLTEERFNPESDQPQQWLRKVRSKIIPNNRRILAVCEANREHASPKERQLLEAFRQHVDDFEAKHLAGAEQNGRRFPDHFEAIFS